MRVGIVPALRCRTELGPSAGGGLEGKIEIQERDGESISPQEAKIWNFHPPSTGCVVLGQIRSPIECHIELPADRMKTRRA
ncbi:MAG TPA: hypothetical protein VN885_05040 [Candidatus Acidoferrales bacterium]|nr:hypothetical protein [Candidatus Acidoferrales bacterium]